MHAGLHAVAGNVKVIVNSQLRVSQTLRRSRGIQVSLNDLSEDVLNIYVDLEGAVMMLMKLSHHGSRHARPLATDQSQTNGISTQARI